MAMDARLTWLHQRNLGIRGVGGGVKELTVDLGPGHRIYFAEDGDAIVVPLCAGDKGSQDRDNEKTQAY